MILAGEWFWVVWPKHKAFDVFLHALRLILEALILHDQRTLPIPRLTNPPAQNLDTDVFGDGKFACGAVAVGICHPVLMAARAFVVFSFHIVLSKEF